MSRQIYSKKDAKRDNAIFEKNLDRYNKIEKALLDLYNAGYWTCDRNVDAEQLWTSARDALGIEPGNSPKRKDNK